MLLLIVKSMVPMLRGVSAQKRRSKMIAYTVTTKKAKLKEVPSVLLVIQYTTRPTREATNAMENSTPKKLTKFGTKTNICDMFTPVQS